MSKIINFMKIEPKLLYLTLYFIFLALFLITGGWRLALSIHVLFVIISSICYFGKQFLIICFLPFIAVLTPINGLLLKRYVRKFKQNVPTEVAVILGHPDITKLMGWIKPDVLVNEVKSLVGSLKSNGKDFSFYLSASLEDVEKIMADRNIKEVYFFGHGTSHTFQLTNDVYIYYCEFKDPKYQKEFVHQVHCGTPHGKSLLDYVVPESNRSKCFFFREPIDGDFIMKEFKHRTKNMEQDFAPTQRTPVHL